MLFAQITLAVVGSYLTLGLFIALAFAWKGAPAIDSNARETDFTFRILLIPGTACLWPIVLRHWRRSQFERRRKE